MNSTVFQTPEWVAAYQASFGTPPIVVAGEDGQASFERADRRGVRILRAYAHDTVDYTDVQALPSLAAADALIEQLLSSADVIDLGQVPPDAAAHRMIQRWPGEVISVPTTACALFEGSSLTSFLERLPGSRRRTFNKLRRRLLTAGITWNASTDADAGTRQLLDWHRAWWRGRGLNPLHESEQFAQFLRMIANGPRGHLMEFNKDGNPVGYSLYLNDRGRAANYLVGYDREASGSLSHTVLEIMAGFEIPDFGGAGVDFLRGDYPEKVRFATSTPLNRRYLLLRPGSRRSQVYAAAAVARAAAHRRPRDAE